MRSGSANAGWVRARAVLEKIARQHGASRSEVEIGRATEIGAGLSRDVFAVELSVRPDPDRVSAL